MVGWIKMPLGTEVGVSPGDIVLDGDPAPPKIENSTPTFWPMSVVAKWLPISATAELLSPPHHNCFTALFPRPPGWAGARRELLDFMVQRKINGGRHADSLAGRHSIRTNQCPLPPSPHFYRPDAFLSPSQQCQTVKLLKAQLLSV